MVYNAKDFASAVRANRPPFSLASYLLRTFASDRKIRSRLLAFIKDLPELKTNNDVINSLRMHLGSARDLPCVLCLVLVLSRVPLCGSIEGAIARWIIEHQLAPHFIVEDRLRLKEIAGQYKSEGSGVVVDLLGERALSRRQAEVNAQKYIELIRNPPSQEPLQIAVKFSSLCENFRSRNKANANVLVDRFAQLLREAKRTRVFIWVDVEEYDVCYLTEDIFLDVISWPEFSHTHNVGIALQAYRKDAASSAQKFIEYARLRGAPFSVRLVKGAYWDSELERAQETGHDFPLFERKEETDKSFDARAEHLLRNAQWINLVGATHAPEQIVNLFNAAERLGINRNQMPECHVLFGAGEPIRRTLCQLCLPVKVYMPVGDLSSGMAFLARRIIENTSGDNFLARLLN